MSLRPFYLLMLTQTFSLIGSRMTSIAIGIRVTVDTGQASPLLLVSFFNELPMMLFGSAAGVLVDRWPRRRVMVLADAGQALGSALLLASFASGAFELWHLYVIVLYQGTCAMFQGPAQDVVTTLLVPDASRDRANALRQMSFPLAGVIAPALTGLLYPLVQMGGIIAIDMVTFLAAVIVVMRMDIPQPPPSEAGHQASGGFWREFRGGFAYLTARRPLLWLILYFAAINFLLNGPLDLTIPYLIRVTGDETLTGLVLAVMNAGALAGGAAITLRRGRRRMSIILPTFVLTGIMFLAYGTSRTPFTLAFSLFCLMFTLPLAWGLFTSLIQVKTPPDMQGRVFSVFGQLSNLASTSSFLLTGLLVDHWIEPAAQKTDWPFAAITGTGPGAGISLVLQAVGMIILALTAYMLLLPRVREVETVLPNYE
jgi:MFS family permease